MSLFKARDCSRETPAPGAAASAQFSDFLGAAAACSRVGSPGDCSSGAASWVKGSRHCSNFGVRSCSLALGVFPRSLASGLFPLLSQ